MNFKQYIRTESEKLDISLENICVTWLHLNV